MRRPRHLLATIATGVALATASAPLAPAASADFSDTLSEVNEGFVGAVDLLVLRPLGIARLAIGAAVIMPLSTTLNFFALPLGRDTSVFKDDWDRYVVEPSEYAFGRKIGVDVAGS